MGAWAAVENYFQLRKRGTTWVTEIRAGLTLFITSVYILALNPLILSGGGLPPADVLLATAISTGCATLIMGGLANYPWVVSVQLGTNVYFVYNVIQPSTSPENCAAQGIPVPEGSEGCFSSVIPFQMALAATFIEGCIFLLIAICGMRSYLMAIFPKQVLMAGASGIGIFIAFVGLRQMGVVVQAPPPNLVAFNAGGWNQCALVDGTILCPWLAIAGLVVTGALTVYMINGSLLIGIFFVTFIAWGVFPSTLPAFHGIPAFTETAGALNFAWGSHTGKLIEAMVTFLYLDFIGSSITFYSLGVMMDIIEEETGIIPNTNKGFVADAAGTMLGGVLGTSCLTTYVESAAAVREGGRTGITAIICAVCFFLMCLLSPIFAGPIPAVATGPFLVIIGVNIFQESVIQIQWDDMVIAIPAFLTIIIMPLTNNIEYGAIAGFIAIILTRLITYQLYPPLQRHFPGYQACTRWLEERKSRSTKMVMVEEDPAESRREMLGEAKASDAEKAEVENSAVLAEDDANTAKPV